MEQKPYIGFLPLPRGVILPFLHKQSSFLEFGFFIALVIECDWDVRHEKYATIKKTDMELAILWGCDVSTIWRYKQKLIKLGLLVKERGLLKVKYLAWFDKVIAYKLAKIPLATPQDLFAHSQDGIAKLHENIAKLQVNQGQNDRQSFKVSSKGDLSLSNDEYESFSDEELDRIAREIDEMRNK